MVSLFPDEKIYGYSFRVEVKGDNAEGEKNRAVELALVATFCEKLKDRREMKYSYVLSTSDDPCQTVSLQSLTSKMNIINLIL